MSEILGIDIGGTGVKAAVVDALTGEVTEEKIKYATPQPSSPKNVGKVINQLIADFKWKGKEIGCGFPSIIKNNICMSAANINNKWLGVNLRKYFIQTTGREATFVNDADAAGIAEIMFGAGKNRKGTVLMLTLGTGIGSGLFLNGRLVPNTEFGHLLYKDSIFEHYASNNARKIKELTWAQWGKELDVFLNHCNRILNPDLIILGGGVSKKFECYEEYVDIPCALTPAQMQNNSGIIGAALMALRARSTNY